jgi:hypothetical protein
MTHAGLSVKFALNVVGLRSRSSTAFSTARLSSSIVLAFVASSSYGSEVLFITSPHILAVLTLRFVFSSRPSDTTELLV